MKCEKAIKCIVYDKKLVREIAEKNRKVLESLGDE